MKIEIKNTGLLEQGTVNYYQLHLGCNWDGEPWSILWVPRKFFGNGEDKYLIKFPVKGQIKRTSRGKNLWHILEKGKDYVFGFTIQNEAGEKSKLLKIHPQPKEILCYLECQAPQGVVNFGVLVQVSRFPVYTSFWEIGDETKKMGVIEFNLEKGELKSRMIKRVPPDLDFLFN